MNVFAISGIKNSGKTTLICAVLPLLAEKGIHTAVIKHDGHDFEADVPGTDSYQYLQSGAVGSAVFSSEKYLAVKKDKRADKTEILLSQFEDADLILLEGYKESSFPKLEVIRKENAPHPVCPAEFLCAVATDLTEEEFRRRNPDFPESIPVLDLNRPEDIAEYLISRRENQGHKERAEETIMQGEMADYSGIWAHTKVVLSKEEDFFGPGIYQLLRRIEQTGSISAAAEEMQISYSKGWKMIRKAEKEAGIRFVDRINGGKNGGSSSLTQEARDFVLRYEQMQKEYGV